MADSWEDDDFEVPQIAQPILPNKDAWDEEEDDPNEGKTPEQLLAEAEKKKKAEAARQLKAHQEAERAERRRLIDEEESRLRAMTPEQRALYMREREEREAAGMAADLFGGAGNRSEGSTTSSKPPTPKSSSGRVGEVKLESTLDFINLAKDLGGKLKKSKAGDVSTFLTEVLSKGAKDPLGVDHLEELISKLTVMRDEKHRLAEAQRNKLSVKEKKLAEKKKDHKQKGKHVAEVFGGDFDDEVDHHMDDRYYDMEDDFM